jgi:hypothetical protein
MAKSIVHPLVAASFLPALDAAAQVKACKAAQILYGNPDFRGPRERPKSGASAKADPPLGWRTLAFAGKNVYTSTGQEVWATDLAGGTLRLVAGEQQNAMPKLAEGPCATARFANIHGITALPDGSLVVADNGANAVLQINSPDDAAKCQVVTLAGTNKPIASVSNMVAGDKDGPVGESKLGLPSWPVADPEGNVYFIDNSTAKLKKIAPDAAHTTTTVATFPRDQGIQTYRGLTILKDKLYASTNNFATGFIFEADPKTGQVRKVLAAQGKDLAEIGPNMGASFSSITDDEKDLFITGSGYIWRVTTGGKVTHVAGAGAPLTWPQGYDPKAEHPAKKVILRYRVSDQSVVGTTAGLEYNDGALYYRGKSDSSYVMKIDCK